MSDGIKHGDLSVLVPIVIGLFAIIALLSKFMAYIFKVAYAKTLWFFVGAIIGTWPSLWRDAAKEGRTKVDVAIMIVAFAAMLAFLLFGAPLFSEIEPSFGAWILAGALLPGISGGALAAVFGLYERIINFLAHPFKRLKENIFFFLPVGIGAILGIFALSFAISFVLGKHESV
ncbi:DUF368 domain-containing protein [Weissella confusa]|uniref:DUF368 domain-containing protein n=1 Tax=Weissella confusa TaxID=1583 RepID=A0A923NEZ3_WEICO|nr:DUF368 domain-containing protein [Weissella confusa]